MAKSIEFDLNAEGWSPNISEEILTRPGDYEGQLPHLRRTIAFVKQYENSRSKGKAIACEQVASWILKDPKNLVPFLINIDLIAQFKPEAALETTIKPLIYDLRGHLDTAASRRSALPSWTPKKVEDVVRLGLDHKNKLVEALALSIQAGYFNAPQTVEEAVDQYYNSAWAMVETEDPEVREEIFSILCLEKWWFHAWSVSAQCFSLGAFASDDTYLRKHHAVIHALDRVGVLIESQKKGQLVKDSVRTWRRVYQIREARGSLQEPTKEKFQKINLQLMTKNPLRYEHLMRFYANEAYTPPFDEIGANSFNQVLEQKESLMGSGASLTWPANITRSLNEPLRILADSVTIPRISKAYCEQRIVYDLEEGYERLTPRSIQLIDNLRMDIVAKGCESPEQKQAVVREVYESLLAGKPVNPTRTLWQPIDPIIKLAGISLSGFGSIFDADQKIKFAIYKYLPSEQIGTLSSILEYHRPLLSLEQVNLIESRITQIRQEIRTTFTRGIGKRGYQLTVSDPMLRSLGYQSITFRQDSDMTKVSLNIDGQTYRFGIDSNYRIIPSEDLKTFQSPQDQAWLELLVLSHLKKVMCVDEDNFEGELIFPEKQSKIFRKQIIGRAEHLKRLPLSHKYSEEAFLRCLKSNLPGNKNLHSINQERGANTQTGFWTYVSPVEVVDTANTKPIQVAFANASEDIRRVIPLAQISPEELSRIEQEILGELEGI